MPWYKVDIPMNDVASGRHMALQGEFAEIFQRFPGSARAVMGMFLLDNVGQSMNVTYFFSPEASRITMPLLRNYGATECEAPRRSDVALTVSPQDVSAIPFAAEE